MPSQATRWNSTFVIVHRYFRFLEFINNDDTLTDFLPGPAANRRQRKFLGDLSKIESVSKELQPCTRAPIAHSPHFEAACVKVLAGKADELARAEATSLRPFVVEDAITETAPMEPEKSPSFVEQLKKHRKLETRASTRYQLISAIPPTSNHVERLFSIAR
ncbi:hypothetical protein PC129_g21530 [Phytophthora cactorum]|uniref:Uncharacterized protein n=1 Tax=Phytophthora cactorum TaxID=29920 RepID=A0A8T1H5V6_9STRA|nr:hypothetical protein PC111_g23525 [Phytophthora cactorum]KAG2872238.1 hypothetical protein PC114_g26493 [Phytophthora cactorum]KAG2876493.1 hypothetical protein PC115_g23611 [Phytophthora cactorum]KAG2925438.1 hypothetical protein PC117_g15184 [Phytophthora cactorum]KAG2961339.1 hypothetical protein PC118_g22026 [Phytophthora cactorum]